MSITAPTAKALSASWTWAFSMSIVVSAGAHFALFTINPEMSSGGTGFHRESMEMVDVLPPEIEIPPPPEAIARPATPVVGAATVDENITIAPTTFEANPVYTLPAPPVASAQPDEDIKAAPRYTPFTVRPELTNLGEVRRLLEKNYPPVMRDAGIGGTVLMWVFIDDAGAVQRTLVKQSSGYRPLDDVALDVANHMQFTPAIYRDLRVPVWLEIPLVFQTK